jgi:hypothetical protein
MLNNPQKLTTITGRVQLPLAQTEIDFRRLPKKGFVFFRRASL